MATAQWIVFKHHKKADDSGYLGTYGYYWFSSPSGTRASGVYFYGSTANVSASYRVNAFSVQCVPIEI